MLEKNLNEKQQNNCSDKENEEVNYNFENKSSRNY